MVPLGSTIVPGRRQLEDVHSTNRALLLALARELRVTTCPVLAARSGLSRATAYVIVDELRRTGVLVEAGPGHSNGGRRPQLLHFEPRARYAVGMEMGERDLHTVLTDLDGTVLQREVTVAQGTTPTPVLAAATESIARLVGQAPKQQVLGIGFAAPGLVDIASGGSYGRGLRLGRGAAGCPLARAHWLASVCRQQKQGGGARGVLQRGGRGCTAAGVRLYRARHCRRYRPGRRGRYGSQLQRWRDRPHTIEPAGGLCDCGNRGCLHTLAAGAVLLARARAHLREDGGEVLRARCGDDLERLTTVQLAEAARDGDSIAAPLVRESGRYLGIAAATVINPINPDRLILGGPLAAAGALFVDAVKEGARRRALAVPFAAVQICPSALGSDAAAIGAAALALGRVAELLVDA
jgi:N-acetylglucosamine repressor